MLYFFRSEIVKTLDIFKLSEKNKLSTLEKLSFFQAVLLSDAPRLVLIESASSRSSMEKEYLEEYIHSRTDRFRKKEKNNGA